MEKINYYDVEAISNSFLRYWECKNNGVSESFREKSWSNFVGDSVHKLMAGELTINDFIVSDSFEANLTENQVLVWEKIKSGVDIEVAVRDVYKVGIDKQILYFKALCEDFEREKVNTLDKINISVVKLQWGKLDSEKISDSRTLSVIKDAYYKLNQTLCLILSKEANGMPVFEDELYFDYRGLKCKGKPDCYFPNNWIEGINTITLIDFKIGEGEIYKKIRDRRYIRQLAFYAKGLYLKYGYIVTVFKILYYNINKQEVEVVEINTLDIYLAQQGGYYTPDTKLFNQRDGIYLTIRQLEWLDFNEFWRTPNPDFYVEGFDKLLDEIGSSEEGKKYVSDNFSESININDDFLPF